MNYEHSFFMVSSEFCHTLPMKYARHFLILIIAVHLSESRSVDRISMPGFFVDSVLRRYFRL